MKFDYCIVAIENFEIVCDEALKMNISLEKLIPIRVFSIPCFDFVKYIHIKKSNVSIISRTCWGGICSHALGLRLNSPFVNLFIDEIEFNKMLLNLKWYLSLPLRYDRDAYDEHLKRTYPVGRLADIYIHFNHYVDFTEAKECWERRVDRINFENLFIISTTESYELAEQFENLPFNHKLIFVPFSCKLKSSVYINWNIKNHEETFGMRANRTASNERGEVLNRINLLALHNNEKNYLRTCLSG